MVVRFRAVGRINQCSSSGMNGGPTWRAVGRGTVSTPSRSGRASEKYSGYPLYRRGNVDKGDLWRDFGTFWGNKTHEHITLADCHWGPIMPRERT